MGCISHQASPYPASCPFLARCASTANFRRDCCHGSDHDDCTLYLTQLLMRTTPLTRIADWPLGTK